MPKRFVHVLLVLGSCAVSACASVHTANRTFEHNRRYRPVRYLGIGDADSLTHYPGEGGAVISISSGGGKGFAQTICVLPPSQSALSVSRKGSGKVSGSGKGAEATLEISTERTEDIARLFEHSERTVFVQTALYRLCEAHANGMLGPAEWASVFDAEVAGVNSAIGLAEQRRERLAVEVRQLGFDESDEKALKKECRKKKVVERRGCNRVVDDYVGAVDLVKRLQVEEKYFKDLSESAALGGGSAGAAYQLGMKRIFDATIRLAEIEIERDRARADMAWAEAERAKAEAEKEKRKSIQKRLVELIELAVGATLK